MVDRRAARALATAERLLPTLVRAFPGLDEERIRDALTDAVLDLSRRPEFTGARSDGPLLYGAARRNCVDIARSEAKRLLRERAYNDRVLADRDAAWDESSIERALILREHVAAVMPDEAMRNVWRL